MQDALAGRFPKDALLNINVPERPLNEVSDTTTHSQLLGRGRVTFLSSLEGKRRECKSEVDHVYELSDVSRSESELMGRFGRPEGNKHPQKLAEWSFWNPSHFILLCLALA